MIIEVRTGTEQNGFKQMFAKMKKINFIKGLISVVAGGLRYIDLIH